uniref:Uncharacterized protein n=1 Tax=Oryza rufipogon TaxID=4529 RepID=A0A0E0NZF3_ORYRU
MRQPHRPAGGPGKRWAKWATARAGAASRRSRPMMGRRAAGEEGHTGRRRSTSTIWRTEREEWGEGRAEADGADVERDGESAAAIAVIVHGVGEAAAAPPVACLPAAEPPPPLPPRPVGFLPNPPAGLPTQTRRGERER